MRRDYEFPIPHAKRMIAPHTAIRKACYMYPCPLSVPYKLYTLHGHHPNAVADGVDEMAFRALHGASSPSGLPRGGARCWSWGDAGDSTTARRANGPSMSDSALEYAV